MQGKSLICLAFLNLSLVLSNCVSAESLELAVEDAAGPWSEKDGTGYANEVVLVSFKAMGIEVKLQVMPYARCKHMVVDGEIAGCFSMSKVSELDKSVMFADQPLFICFSDYFQNPKKTIAAKAQSELSRGTVVGTVEGYEYSPSFYKLQENGTIVIEESATEDLNLKKLADGRIDAALINYNDVKPAGYMTAKAGVKGKVECAFRSGTLESFIGFSRKHPKGAWARDQFNAGFKVIAENGTLQSIQAKWTETARKKIEKLEDETKKETIETGTKGK